MGNGVVKYSKLGGGGGGGVSAVTGTAPSALSGLAVANQAVTSTVKVAVSNPGVDAGANCV